MMGRYVRCYNAEIETDKLHIRFYRWQDDITSIHSDSTKREYKDTDKFKVYIDVISKTSTREVFQDFEVTRTTKEILKRYEGYVDGKDNANSIWKNAKDGKSASNLFKFIHDMQIKEVRE